MSEARDRKTIVINRKDAPDVKISINDYLETLASPVRLFILEILLKNNMDVETISSAIYKKFGRGSRENTERHLKKLLHVGFIMPQKDFNLDMPGRDHRKVTNYRVVPGSLENAIRTLGKIIKLDISIETNQTAMDVQTNLWKEFLAEYATLTVMGGENDGKKFPLIENQVRLGRIDPAKENKCEVAKDVVLSDWYSSASRVWKPHAILFSENGQWYVEHCEGRFGTFVNDRALLKSRKELLKHDDIIRLGEGEKAACLLFQLPKKQNQAPISKKNNNEPT